jgi:serine/threonine protein kinase
MATPHTILVVDDEPAVVDSLKDLLRTQYRVLGATSGREGLELLRQQEVHIIITDQRMPGLDGVSLLSHARQLQPDAIRFLLTGYADVGAVIDAINQGSISQYISKPWDPDELLAIVRHAAEHYDLRCERKRLVVELQEKNTQLDQANARLQTLTDQLLKANSALLNSLSKDKQQLGQYRLLEKLTHQGGMGTVYKALHVLLMKVVALKVLPSERMNHAEAVTRFQREMKAVGRLNHPNIVQASDAGESDGTYYLVMEFVEGIDLSSLIASRGALPLADACELARQAALGLQHAHEHGLVHRDLKPSNLMLTLSGTVKMLDLGLARFCNEGSTSNLLTDPGQVMGTADYMAPEQAFGMHPVDIRADIYSLGCTLYHLLAGNPPFSSPEYTSPLRKLLAHSQSPATPIRDLRGDVSEELAELLCRLMAKTPAERLQEPAELARSLESFARGSDLPKLMRSLDLPANPSTTTAISTAPLS